MDSVFSLNEKPKKTKDIDGKTIESIAEDDIDSKEVYSDNSDSSDTVNNDNINNLFSSKDLELKENLLISDF